MKVDKMDNSGWNRCKGMKVDKMDESRWKLMTVIKDDESGNCCCFPSLP